MIMKLSLRLKMFKIRILFFVFIFLVGNVTALNVSLDVSNSFSSGELILFNYTFFSDQNVEIMYIPSIFCSEKMVAPLENKKVNLEINQLYTAVYTDQVVEDWFQPQTCAASVQILSPIRKTVSKNFSIITDPSFSFDLIFDKKVFVQGEEINLDYISDTEDLSIMSTLIYPDKKTKAITLPKSIKVSQIGTYELDVMASKEGYKTITKKEQFGVIKEQANLKNYSFANESKDFNDSKEGFRENQKDSIKTEELVFLFFLILLGIILVYFLHKSRD